MANVQHSTLTGADLHELKGAASAAADTVPVADGSGSTSFEKISTSSIDTSSIFRTNKLTLTVRFPDISTAGSIYVPIPVACTVSLIYTALQTAITGADAVLTFRNHAGNSMGTITVAFTGAAAGDVDTLTPSSNNTFSAGERMKIDSDGASSTSADSVIVIELTQTA